MEGQEQLASEFENHRQRLRSVAYRMLGSSTEADDAVQETWLRVSRKDTSGIENFGAWLTTIVGRVSLNMLRARRTRREDALPDADSGQAVIGAGGADPECEALLADSVGQAMLIVLDTLTPAERLAFVLHDTFAVPFDEIAAILDRTPEATRQLASRARRRVRAAESIPEVETEAQRAAVDAFLDASRNGDFAKLVAVLHPDVVLRVDLGAAAGAPQVIRGAEAVAARAQLHSRRDLVIQRALIDGAFGMIATRNGQRHAAGRFTVKDGRIVEFEILADPERLGQLDVSIMER